MRIANARGLNCGACVSVADVAAGASSRSVSSFSKPIAYSRKSCLDSSPAVLTTSASCRAKSSTRWSSSRWCAAAGSGVRRSSAKRGFLGPCRGVVNEPGVRCWLPDRIRRSPLLSARRREHTASMRLDYGRDEILAEHRYERPLVLDGVPCHGGFIDGRYVSPRTLWRAPAIEAWQSRLPAGELAAVLDPITARVPPHFPSVAQTKLLVRYGVTVPLVRILTIIAIIEGFGGEVLRLVRLPPLGERVLDPIQGTALAHLGALFEAHARDEAGHRRMWELARDIALDRPPVPKDLASSVTPAGAPRLLSEIPFDMEALVLRMLGVLVIEVFAVAAFRWAKEVLGDPALFRRHEEARTLIGYIQQDETPHVGYLATALAELRCRSLAGASGTVPGLEIVDRARDMIVGFQAGPRHRANVEFRTQVVERCVADHLRREVLLAEFRTLG